MQVILAGLLAAGSTGAAPAAPDFEALWKANQWFELRDSVRTAEPPAFYRGAAAAAFGARREAERFLARANRLDADPIHRAAAAGYLAAVDDRLGKYRAAFDWYQRMAAVSAQTDSPWRQSGSLPLLKAFSRFPDLQVKRRGYARVECSKDRGVVAVAVEINGKSGCYSLDTSSAYSSMGESEAKRVGLEMLDEGFDLNGVHVRTGVVRELKTGQFRIRNAAFVVFPDNVPVFGAEPGILGIPLVAAFETIRWGADGAVEIGFPSDGAAAEPNMYFNWVLPLIGIDVAGRRVSLQFDTGSDHTFLWPEFARAFPTVKVLAGPLDSYEQLGLFGRTVMPFWPIPELQIGLGGAPLTLRGVKLLAVDTQKNCQWCYGTLGVDLLGDAGAVCIDFRAMRVTLRGRPAR